MVACWSGMLCATVNAVAIAKPRPYEVRHRAHSVGGVSILRRQVGRLDVSLKGAEELRESEHSLPYLPAFLLSSAGKLMYPLCVRKGGMSCRFGSTPEGLVLAIRLQALLWSTVPKVMGAAKMVTP